MRTTVQAPDEGHDRIRKGRLEWVAQTLRLPVQMSAQGLDRARWLGRRERGQER